MPDPTTITVSSIAEFAGAVEESLKSTLTVQADCQFKGNWYRGVGQSKNHKLVPALYRHPSHRDSKSLLQLERLMLEDFIRQNVLHSGVAPTGLRSATEEDGDFRSLFYMQHYGVPTRLLDWTSNPFIALYFALSSAKRKDRSTGYEDDAAVWILDPVSWNKKALDNLHYGNRGPLTLADDEVKGYNPRKLTQGQLSAIEAEGVYEQPVAMLGIANNARMFAQKGVFTIFGKDLRPMEEQFKKNDFPSNSLVKIVIPKEQIAELAERLIRIGYTDSVSYPDLHGLAMEIKRIHGFAV